MTDKSLKIELILEQANVAWNEYTRLEDESRAALQKRNVLHNQAGNLLFDGIFHTGDIIEYTERQGWRNGGKVKSLRMMVKSFYFSGNSVEVRGWQVNKAREVSRISKSFIITPDVNPFVCVVKKGNEE